MYLEGLLLRYYSHSKWMRPPRFHQLRPAGFPGQFEARKPSHPTQPIHASQVSHVSQVSPCVRIVVAFYLCLKSMCSKVSFFWMHFLRCAMECSCKLGLIGRGRRAKHYSLSRAQSFYYVWATEADMFHFVYEKVPITVMAKFNMGSRQSPAAVCVSAAACRRPPAWAGWAPWRFLVWYCRLD